MTYRDDFGVGVERENFASVLLNQVLIKRRVFADPDAAYVLGFSVSTCSPH